MESVREERDVRRVGEPSATAGGDEPSGPVFDPFEGSVRVDPYPHYRELREQNPVHWSPVLESWVLARNADVGRAIREPTLRMRPPEEVLAERELPPDDPLVRLGDTLLMKDPPDHTRLRRLVHKAFTPRTVEGLRPVIRRLVDDLLDPLEPGVEVDLIEGLAHPLPVSVICEMLDIPPGDRPTFKELSRDLAGVVDIPLSPEIVERGRAAAGQLLEYFAGLVEERRRDPGDDLLSGLVLAEDDGDALTHSELLAMSVQLLFAGHETTQNLIGNGVLALLRNRAQWERLREDPGLVEVAVEELLRYDSPAQLAGRWTTEEVGLAGRRIPAGQRVTMLLGAANRDPEAFTDPDRLDVARDAGRHLSFGGGIHFCLGAHLARVEGRVVFDALVERVPTLELAAEEMQWRETLALRGLQSLPVAFSPL